MIEASVDQLKGFAEKEWYFGNQEKERRGPFSFPEVGSVVALFFFLCSVSLQCFFCHICYRSFTGMLFFWFFVLFYSTDEGNVGRWDIEANHTMLGSRDGWLEASHFHTTVEVVAMRNWSPHLKRFWSSSHMLEYDDHHLSILPKQVCLICSSCMKNFLHSPHLLF